jgi:hypothetical protein
MRKVNKQQIKAKAKQSLKEDLCRWQFELRGYKED